MYISPSKSKKPSPSAGASTHSPGNSYSPTATPANPALPAPTVIPAHLSFLRAQETSSPSPFADCYEVCLQTLRPDQGPSPLRNDQPHPPYPWNQRIGALRKSLLRRRQLDTIRPRGQPDRLQSCPSRDHTNPGSDNPPTPAILPNCLARLYHYHVRQLPGHGDPGGTLHTAGRDHLGPTSGRECRKISEYCTSL